MFIWTTHNEYLQVAAEQGVVGLVGLGALAAAVGATVYAGWHSRSRSQSDTGPGADLGSLRAGAIAGLVCLALHSAFDFLWHVPAVPMIAAIAVGLAARRLQTEQPSQPRTKEIS